MSVAYGKGDKGKATKLHSEIVRSLGYCENCGSSNYLQCAHIIGRRYSATRTSLLNAFCLCAGCHRKFTDWPREFSHFITDSWAAVHYDDLKAQANTATKMDWTAELARLKEIKKQIDKGVSLQELRGL